MESTEFADQFMAGSQKKMVGVAEDDAGLEFVPKIPLVETFDRCLGADRHENGGRNVAVFGVQNARASARNRAFGEEFEGDLAGQLRLYCLALALR